MKRISILMAALVLWAAPASRAQDAAAQERMNKMSGQIDDLIAGQKAIREQTAALAKELASLRDEQTKPNSSYASQEELRRLAESIKEVDRKRLEDAEKIHAELLKLRQALIAPPPSTKRIPSAPAPDSPVPDKTATTDKGFEYVIKDGDSLSLIVQAYREKNIKVTIDQILKANPGLVPEKLKVRQKIFIPAPPS